MPLAGVSSYTFRCVMIARTSNVPQWLQFRFQGILFEVSWSGQVMYLAWLREKKEFSYEIKYSHLQNGGYTVHHKHKQNNAYSSSWPMICPKWCSPVRARGTRQREGIVTQDVYLKYISSGLIVSINMATPELMWSHHYFSEVHAVLICQGS